jgi:hypothetical protein
MRDYASKKHYAESQRLTPKGWQHIRIVKQTERLFGVLTLVAFSPIGEADMIALGLEPERTQGITKKNALEVGARIETAIAQQNYKLGRGRSKKGKRR